MGMDRIIQRKKWTSKKIAKWGVIAGYMILVLSPLVSQVWKAMLNVKTRRLTVSEVMLDTLREYPPVIGEAVKFVFKDILLRK